MLHCVGSRHSSPGSQSPIQLGKEEDCFSNKDSEAQLDLKTLSISSEPSRIQQVYQINTTDSEVGFCLLQEFPGCLEQPKLKLCRPGALSDLE